VGFFPEHSSVYRLVGSKLMNIDEDWRAGRLYMAKDGIQKLLNPEMEKDSNTKFILEEELINLEAQNSIYTT